MIILGLQFGHDATACVLRDGVIVAARLKERHNRIRHAIGLNWADVLAVLAEADLTPDDVDYCSVTSTQDVEYVFTDPRNLSFGPGGALPSPYYERVSRENGRFPLEGGAFALRDVAASGQPHHYQRLFDQYADLAGAVSFPSVEDFDSAPQWSMSRTLADIASTDYSSLLKHDFATGFHLPVTVRLGGREVPGALFAHHYAHAAYAFFAGPFTSAAVLSHDGGSARRGYRSGLFFWGNGDTLYPLTPHYLLLGWTYYEVARAVGLGEVGGEGKLMGLSAYGSPVLLPEGFVGNYFDGPRTGTAKMPDKLLSGMLAAAKEIGYDTSVFGKSEHATAPVNADVAASTQFLFEETMLSAVRTLHGALVSSGISEGNLCLGGGTALNCPANSRILAESDFAAVAVPPACDDSGLAIGSAYALYHCVLRQPRPTPPPPSSTEIAYLGERIRAADLHHELRESGAPVHAVTVTDVAAEAASLLAEGRVIGLAQGRSEVGPRALGNRSILASPEVAENWRRVNDIKGRERWRPLAPAVLADHAADWFQGAPDPSPYMLFNAEVLSDRLPAVTHVDGSARIQTVSAANGLFHDVLTAFHTRTGIPVLLNTSLNGPGEPIVATAENAVRFLLRSGIDTLFVEDTKITRY